MSWLHDLERLAKDRACSGAVGAMRSRGTDGDCVNLAGEDYLGLSGHPRVVDAAAHALRGYGLGAAGSRLGHGSVHEHEWLEAALGGLLGGAALVCSSRHLANLSAMRALSHGRTLVVHEVEAHAAVVDACRGTDVQTATVARGDVAAVESLLTEHGGRAVVVTESVSAAYGDSTALAPLYLLCREHGAGLLVDETHAVGVTGPAGAGEVAAAGLTAADDLMVTASLSTALGAAGAVVVGPAALRRHLLEAESGFGGDSALPPAVAAGALAALDLALDANEGRLEISGRAAYAAGALDLPLPAAGMLTVPTPDFAHARDWAQACREANVAVGCLLPPEAPGAGPGLRLTVDVSVPRAQFDRAVVTVAKTRPK